MFKYDFNNAKPNTYKTIKVNPDGWINPIVVEYCIGQAHQYDPQLSVIWRVKGTEHCFTIYEQKINVLSNADYKKHFEEVLQNFRFDYWTWFNDKKYKDAEWKYEYEKQFSGFMLPEREQDHFSDYTKD